MRQSARVAKVQLDGWKCERCGHTWVPRVFTVQPAVCPKCKSPYWNRPRKAKHWACHLSGVILTETARSYNSWPPFAACDPDYLCGRGGVATLLQDAAVPVGSCDPKYLCLLMTRQRIAVSLQDRARLCGHRAGV